MKRTTLILLGVLVLPAVSGAFLFRQKKDASKTSSTNLNQNAQTPGTSQENVKESNQNPILQPSSEYSIRPDFSKVKDFNKTLSLQKGVSVKYGNGWIGKKMENSDNVVSGQLVKTVNGRSYEISFGEINHSTTDITDAKIYAKFDVNGKTHSIDITSISSVDGIHDYASVSSCSEQTQNDCSLTLGKNYLHMMLRQYVPNAQESVSLDFSRSDDQQALAEFTEIASTLKY